jgi:hypothetical protein
MSESQPPTTDTAPLALLRFDPALDAQPAAKARVLGRVEATLGTLAAASSQACSGTVEHQRPSSANDDAVLSSHRALRPAPPVRAMWALGGKPVAMVTAAFFFGGVGGAGLYATFAPPKERVVYIDRPIAVSEPRPFAFDALNRTPEAPAREGELAGSPKIRGNSAPVVSALAAERELLDRARKALSRGDTSDAERALDLHTRRHPTGLLLEEREALAIKVLVDLGRAEEAHRRAVKFKERHPRSLFGPSVEEAIGTIR